MTKILANRGEYLEYIKSLLPENPRVLEIGVEAGNFSDEILKILQPEELHLLDPWEYSSANGNVYMEGHMRGTPTAYSNVSMKRNIENKYVEEIKSGIVHIHQGYSYDLVDNFEHAYFDFVYIDGCHLYESVKKDILMYVKKVNPDGILGGHDYISVSRSFVQNGITYSNQLGFGIKRAVDEFLEEHPFLEMCAMVSDEIPFPDWAIRRKK